MSRDLNVANLPCRTSMYSVKHRETGEVIGAFGRFDPANELKLERNKQEGKNLFCVGHFWEYVDLNEEEIETYEGDN